MKARRQRRARHRKILVLSLAAALVAVVAIAVYAYSSLESPMEAMVGKPVSSDVYNRLYGVATSSFGTSNRTLLSEVRPTFGQAFASNGKPIVLFVSADYCPFCAFQRWPLVIALMRFGNFTNLSYMLSSPTDVYANSPTFSFYQSTYASKYIVFQGYEEADRSENPLQPAPSNYSSLFQQYGHGAYPFLDFANRYYVSGSFEYPNLLAGKDWNQIAGLLGGSSQLSEQVIDSAAVITSAICKVDGGQPASVCSVGSVIGMTQSLAWASQSARVTLTAGTTSASPSAWATVQYGQMAWSTTSSTKTRYDTPMADITQRGIRA